MEGLNQRGYEWAWLTSIVAVLLCTPFGLIAVGLCIAALRKKSQGATVQANNYIHYALWVSITGLVLGGMVVATRVLR